MFHAGNDMFAITMGSIHYDITYANFNSYSASWFLEISTAILSGMISLAKIAQYLQCT